MRPVFKYATAALLVLLLANCVKKKTYTTEPEIEFKSIVETSPQKIDLTFTFKDGDGDVGKDPEDQTSNVFLRMFYFDTITSKFKFQPDPLFPDSLTHYTIRKTPAYAAGKPVLGDCTLSIDLTGFYARRVKWDIYMFDNAGNKSNTITTAEYVRP